MRRRAPPSSWSRQTSFSTAQRPPKSRRSTTAFSIPTPPTRSRRIPPRASAHPRCAERTDASPRLGSRPDVPRRDVRRRVCPPLSVRPPSPTPASRQSALMRDPEQSRDRCRPGEGARAFYVPDWRCQGVGEALRLVWAWRSRCPQVHPELRLSGPCLRPGGRSVARAARATAPDVGPIGPDGGAHGRRRPPDLERQRDE